MGTIKTTNIETITGSGTLTIGQSGETISIPSGVTFSNSGTVTGFGANTPVFHAYVNAAQSITSGVETKITLGGISLDTDSAFASSKFTVPSGKAGKYYLYGQAGYNSGTTWNIHFVKIYKNGAQIAKTSNRAEYDTLNNICIITNLSEGDYIELYVNQQSGSSQDIRTAAGECFLQGFKLIG